MTVGCTLGGREKSEKKDKGGEIHRVGKMKGGGGRRGGMGSGLRGRRNKRMAVENKKGGTDLLVSFSLVTITL